ncbi:MAG TPA: hypothetical protein VL967_05310 [Terracidiphilus sp.]|nr:hypothetical protein [Terracidiphilus sp.]
MRRSREVKLTLLAAVALSVTGCRERRDCVDAQNHIRPDGYCQASDSHSLGYHYVYGGSTGGHVGDTVVGGSATPRGGFGAFGGGGDAAGGE